jgi:hypothetical protein
VGMLARGGHRHLTPAVQRLAAVCITATHGRQEGSLVRKGMLHMTGAGRTRDCTATMCSSCLCQHAGAVILLSGSGAARCVLVLQAGGAGHGTRGQWRTSLSDVSTAYPQCWHNATSERRTQPPSCLRVRPGVPQSEFRHAHIMQHTDASLRDG